MSGYFLLFDAQCPQCTRVAKRLRELEIRDLEVKSQYDPQIAELFAAAERSVPDKPALVHAAEQGLTVHTGLAMRMRLARMLGIRRAAEIVGLMAAELKAHVSRHNGDTERGVSRRRMLGGTAAAGAGALLFGTAMSSPAGATPSTQDGVRLSIAARQRLLATPTLQRASRVWGAVDETAITTAVTKDGMNVALVPHRGEPGALTAVNLDDPGTPAITTTLAPGGQGFRHFLAETGTPLFELTAHNGQVSTTQLDASAAPPTAGPEPEGLKEFAVCLAICVGAEITPDCVAYCQRCVAGPIWEKPVVCPLCANCLRGLISCAWGCKDVL